MTTSRQAEQVVAPEIAERAARPAPKSGPQRGPASLLALQRSAGNRAVAAALQRTRAAPAAPAAVAVARAGIAGPEAAPSVETVPAAVEAEKVAAGRTTTPSPPAAPPADGTPRRTVQRGLFDDPLGAIADVAGGVRDRVLESVAGMARRMPGYELLCTVLGRDVVTGTAVPRTSAALIAGFLALIPGADRIRQNLQESGAIDRAGEWLDQEVPRLGLNFDTIRALFRAAWDALGPGDLLDPAAAFQQIAGIFGPPLGRLRDFAVAAGKKMLEFVFEGALSLAGGLGGQVMGIIRRAGGVFDRIIQDPVGFAGNLIAAVRGGLGAFMTNVGTHLRNGLIGWLTGSLGGIIRIPAQFNLAGIVGMALDFLGITWDRVKGKLARLIGDRAVALLERGAGIVASIVQNGLSAITSRIAEFTSGIVETVVGGIREWVTNSVVGAAITRLISMFNPAGAVIQAIIAVYNTVQFFIERAQQLGALASAVFDSIAAIASGGIGGAIQYVEQALGRAVPVVLGFLARLIGLGDVAAPVRNVMQRVQTVIDGALDRVVGWIAELAQRVGSALRGGTSRASGRDGTERSLRPALSDANRLLDAPGASEASVRAGLSGLRERHRLSAATLIAAPTAGSFHIHVQREAEDTPNKSLAPASGTESSEALFTNMDIDALKNLAPNSPDAAHALIGRYRAMPDGEIFRRYANDSDETAAAEVARRYPDAEEALRRALDSNYRPPHTATVALIRRDGTVEWPAQTFQSGGAGGPWRMSSAERALGFPRSMLATHTEFRAVHQARLQAGDRLEILGQYDPCGSCDGIMRGNAMRTGATIVYSWPGGTRTYGPLRRAPG